MLSQKARYALHSLIVLAERGGDEPMMIADIAEEANVPRKFLEQILLGLKRRGIVRSHRGRQGGYLLGRPAVRNHASPTSSGKPTAPSR